MCELIATGNHFSKLVLTLSPIADQGIISAACPSISTSCSDDIGYLLLVYCRSLEALYKCLHMFLHNTKCSR